MLLELNEVDQAIEVALRKHQRSRHLLAVLKKESVRLKVLADCFRLGSMDSQSTPKQFEQICHFQR